jgi:hypothetical protein
MTHDLCFWVSCAIVWLLGAEYTIMLACQRAKLDIGILARIICLFLWPVALPFVCFSAGPEQ